MEEPVDNTSAAISGVASNIPFVGKPASALAGLASRGVQGAVLGLAEQAARTGLKEGRLPTGREAALSAGFGGLAGGAFGSVEGAARGFGQRLGAARAAAKMDALTEELAGMGGAGAARVSTPPEPPPQYVKSWREAVALLKNEQNQIIKGELAGNINRGGGTLMDRANYGPQGLLASMTQPGEAGTAPPPLIGGQKPVGGRLSAAKATEFAPTLQAMLTPEDLLWTQQVADLEEVPQGDLAEAWDVFRRYQDKEWSFTDCTSKVVIARLGITEAFAFDHHFEQFGTVTRVP